MDAALTPLTPFTLHAQVFNVAVFHAHVLVQVFNVNSFLPIRWRTPLAGRAAALLASSPLPTALSRPHRPGSVCLGVRVALAVVPPWRRKWSSKRAPVHQTQHHSPARACAERHHPGVVGEPAAGCIPAVPPVGGWGRLGASSWPQIRRWDYRRCCGRISGPPGGPELRWSLSVGWCPSTGGVVVHYARPYTAPPVSGGCVTAISGSASKFAEGTCYKKLGERHACKNVSWQPRKR
jgi:hypothetical protein